MVSGTEMTAIEALTSRNYFAHSIMTTGSGSGAGHGFSYSDPDKKNSSWIIFWQKKRAAIMDYKALHAF